MIPELDKLAYSLPNFAKAVDLSVDTVRKAIERGDLIPGYPNSKPIVSKAEGERWLSTLPAEKPARRAS